MKHQRNLLIGSFIVVAFGAASSLHAASATWDGDTNGNWNNSNNWSAAFPNGSGQIATFNADVTNSSITLGQDITITSIKFDTANSEAYTFNAGNKFILGGSGDITVDGTVTTSQTINTNLQLGGNGSAATYNIVNNSTTADQFLTFGGAITGGSSGTAGVKVLALAGAGNINLNGIISNGGATNVALTKSGAGIVTLSNTNTNTGTTTITGGTLTVGSGGVINNTNATTGTGSISGGSTLRIDGGTVKFNTTASGNAGLQVGTTTAGNVVVTNDGTLAISTGRLILGGSGAGSGTSTFTQDSGTTTVASNLYTANYNATDMNISGGDFTVSGSSVISQRANTNFNISGTANVSFGAQVTLGGQTGTYDAIINLNGGTLSIVNIANAANGNTSFNFDGGILKATANNSAFLIADNAYIKNGGGTVDTQAFNVTISQPLQRFTGATTDVITKTGTGALTLTGANTYGGGTNIQNGSIILGVGNDRLLTTGSVILGAASTTGNLVLGDGTARNQTLAGLTTMGMGGSVVGGAATNSTLTLNIAGTSEFNGTLGGAGTNENNLAFSKSGVGKLTLSGTNTFVGNVTLGTNSGTLRITNSSALGTGTKTVTNVSASSSSPGQSNALELDSNGGADISLASTISFTTSGSNGVILNTAGNNTISGNISMALGNGNTKIISNGGSLTLAGNISAAAADRALDLAGSSIGNNEFSGVLSNGSTPSLLKSGDGKWILSGANTFRGTTTITGGTLALTNNLALQTSTLNTDFTGGGSLDLTGVNTPTIGALAGAGNLAMPSNLTSLTLNPQSGSASYSGNISGGTGMKLIKSGATGTTQTLTGTNTYTGATEIEVGALNIASNTALNGTSGVAITSTAVAGGILELANGVTITGKSVTISGYGGTNVRGSLRSASDATAEWAGPVVIGGVSSPVDTRVGAMPNSTLTISGKISNGTLSNFIVSADVANGKVIVSGANDYTGQTQIFRGTLALGADNSLPTGSVLNVHSVSGITDTATFDLNNYNQEVGGLLRGNTAGPAIVTNSGVNEKTLTITNTSNHTFDSAITGNLALVKSGAGTQTLSGSNTYTGTTTVSAGTLVINGNISSSSTTVQSGGTLAGSGTTGSLTIDNGGTLAPGNSPGTLTVSGDLGLNDASILAFEFDPLNMAVGGGVNDLVTGISNFTLDGLLNVTATSGSFSGVTSGTWRLFEYSGTLTNNLLNLTDMPDLDSGYSWSLDTATAGQINLTVVPEPRAALLGGLGMLALLRRRRA